MAQLEDLLVDGEDVDRDLVAEVLAPYVRLDRQSGAIHPQPAWDSLSAQRQILVFLAARKACRTLGLTTTSEEAMPQEIEAGTGIVGATVRPALFRLQKKRLIEKRHGDGYCVPNWALSRVRDELTARNGEAK